MDNAKKDLIWEIGEKLIFVYLVIFPLGQLIRVNFNFLGTKIPIHPTDVITLISVPFFLLGHLKQPKFFPSVLSFLVVATFSLLLSLNYFSAREVAVGTLYWLRYLSYSTFFLLVWNIVRDKKKLRVTLFDSLISVCFFIGLFGWIQYFWIPDLTSLRYVGWDDHLNRLVGTFLDPGFTGIILVLGFLASFNKFLERKDKTMFWLSLMFLLTLALTYSRASYLAFAAAVFATALFKRGAKKSAILVLILLIIAVFLPRPAGEGVRLERVASLHARAQNYQQTLTLIKAHPLFGIGFNNLCAERNRLFGGIGYQSHACSGADSSLLLVVATTGTVGLTVFLYMAWRILKSLRQDFFGKTFIASAVALLVHSLFVNSLFYPWVMGFLAVLLAISLRE